MKRRMIDFKNRDNYFRHLSQLFTIQFTQFVYDGLPETIPAEFLEFYLLINGTVAIGPVQELKDDRIYCAIGSYNGDINGYLPSNYTAAVTGLGEISGKWYGPDNDIVVGLNNSTRAPEFDIPFTADVLSQVDISENMNVIFARFSRLPFADNDKQKAQIESAIKSIIKGDPLAVATKDTSNAFEEFISDGRNSGDKFLDLVDVDKIDGLQYLNQYHDNVVKRFLLRRGYMMTTTSKMAQQTNAELHGADSYALLYPAEQLRCRQKMCEQINSLYGLNVSVDYNPILKRVYESYFTATEQGQNAPSDPDPVLDDGGNDPPLKNDSGTPDDVKGDNNNDE